MQIASPKPSRGLHAACSSPPRGLPYASRSFPESSPKPPRGLPDASRSFTTASQRPPEASHNPCVFTYMYQDCFVALRLHVRSLSELTMIDGTHERMLHQLTLARACVNGLLRHAARRFCSSDIVTFPLVSPASNCTRGPRIRL